MKAEETVIKPSFEELEFLTETQLNNLQRIRLPQAKVSFRAGQKEIMDWRQEICPHSSYRNSSNVIIHGQKWYCKKCWEAKVKELEGKK